MPTGTVLLLGDHGAEDRKHLLGFLASDWHIDTWAASADDETLENKLRQADALVIGADALLSGRVLPRISVAGQLRLFQIPFAGHDWLDPQILPANCVACNLHEHSSAIAEFVLLAILEWQIGLMRNIDADFRQGSWRYNGSRISGIKHNEIKGKILGLFGYGHIGEAIAERAAAFGMRVAAVGSRARFETPEPLHWFEGPNGMDRLLRESDFLVVACALNESTRGAVDYKALSAMKPSAFLVNVARAPIVVEEDLYMALKEGVIAGAMLDVWYREPTQSSPSPSPSQHPFHALPNVIMTPHCAGWTHEQGGRRWRAIAENLDRLALGQPLRNVVARPGAPIVV